MATHTVQVCSPSTSTRHSGGRCTCPAHAPHTPRTRTLHACLHTPCTRRDVRVQVRMAAASEQLSRLFEHTYVFQCYQPTYSSGHYAFMFASRTRLRRARAARLLAIPSAPLPTGLARTDPHLGAPAWPPTCLAQGAPSLGRVLARRPCARPRPPMPRAAYVATSRRVGCTPLRSILSVTGCTRSRPRSTGRGALPTPHTYREIDTLHLALTRRSIPATAPRAPRAPPTPPTSPTLTAC